VGVLCLGESIVDLVCERPVREFIEAEAFVPHCGGAIANAAVAAARCGAQVSLAGGAGGDAWGAWLEQRLKDEGIDLRWWSRIDGLATPVAFVVVDERGEPGFLVYGHGIEAAMKSVAGELEIAIEASSAVLLGSNTLVGGVERELSLRARHLALSNQTPLLVDVNLRSHRWSDIAIAVRLTRDLCDGALLVKVNRDESHKLTDEGDPAAAAEAIRSWGCEEVVVTLGADGALARGTVNVEVPGVPAKAIDTTGAGDVVTGVLVAALAAREFDPEAIADALPAAVATAARSTEGWGAIDALPESVSVFR
jgi:sugar/nucleoside kinase (ribokinase family)